MVQGVLIHKGHDARQGRGIGLSDDALSGVTTWGRSRNVHVASWTMVESFWCNWVVRISFEDCFCWSFKIIIIRSKGAVLATVTGRIVFFIKEVPRSVVGDDLSTNAA